MDQKTVNGKGTAWGKKRDGITDEALNNHRGFGIGKEEKDESAVETIFGLEKDSVGGKGFFGFRHSTDSYLLRGYLTWRRNDRGLNIRFNLLSL